MKTTVLLDEFDIIIRAAAEQSSHALSLLVGSAVDIQLDPPRWTPLEAVPARLGPAETVLIAIHIALAGAVGGDTLLAFNERQASALCRRLGSPCPDPRAFGELEQSMIQETGNILVSALGNSIGSHLGCSVRPHPPALLHDLAGAIASALLCGPAATAEEVLCCGMSLFIGGDAVAGDFLFCPLPATLDLVAREYGDD